MPKPVIKIEDVLTDDMRIGAFITLTNGAEELTVLLEYGPVIEETPRSRWQEFAGKWQANSALNGLRFQQVSNFDEWEAELER